MFSNAVNKVELSKVAREFLALLESCQLNNEAARSVLIRAKGLIEAAINEEIDAPLPNGFFPEEFWEDGDLFAFDELGEAASNFNLLLRGANSVAAISESVHDIEARAEEDEQKFRGGS